MDFKTLSHFLRFFDQSIKDDVSILDQINQVKSDVAQINEKLCTKIFNGDERFMNAFFHISKCLSNYDAKVELTTESNEIRIFNKNEDTGYYKSIFDKEICFRYIKESEGSKCFQLTYSNIHNRADRSAPGFYENQPLVEQDEIIDWGCNV